MTYVSCVRPNAAIATLRSERARIRDGFERFLCQFASEKYLIRPYAPVIRTLEAASRDLKTTYGKKFLSLSLGGSHMTDLNGAGSDVDYYVIMDNIPGDRNQDIVATVNGHLRNSEFLPCSASSQHIFILPREYGEGIPYEFVPDEFSFGRTVPGLCRAIGDDKCPIAFKAPDGTIERLNEILRTPGFIAAMLPIKQAQSNVPQNLAGRLSIRKALEMREAEFDALDAADRQKVVERTRMFLDLVYPQACPKLAWAKAPINEFWLLLLLPFASIHIAGDAELIKKIALQRYRLSLEDRMRGQDRQFRLNEQEVMAGNFRRTLGIDAAYVVKRFLNNKCRLLATEASLAGLRDDKQFVGELMSMAGPYIAERERLLPLPAEIREIILP